MQSARLAGTRAVFEKLWRVLARGSNGIWALESPPRPQVSVIRCIMRKLQCIWDARSPLLVCQEQTSGFARSWSRQTSGNHRAFRILANPATKNASPRCPKGEKRQCVAGVHKPHCPLLPAQRGPRLRMTGRPSLGTRKLDRLAG